MPPRRQERGSLDVASFAVFIPIRLESMGEEELEGAAATQVPV